MFRGAFCVDGHADILYEMERRKQPFYASESTLQASWEKLRTGGIDVQFFSLFVDPDLSAEMQLTRILLYIELFRGQVESAHTVAVTSALHLREALSAGRLAAVLALEGAHCLQSDLRILHTLYRLGVRAVGLTWNYANCIADGVGEARGAGLTQFGKSLIVEMNRLNMIIDCAHLSERGFWDVAECSSGPFVVSHANSKFVYDHRRNMTDEQIRALIAKNGLIGLTFVPGFVDGTMPTIDALLRHLDHILTLGGAKHVGLGSDFDGIDVTMPDLQNAACLPLLLEEIERRYGSEVLYDVAGRNWIRVLETVLQKE